MGPCASGRRVPGLAAAALLAALLLPAPGPPGLAHGLGTSFGWPDFAEVTAEAGLGGFLHGGWLGDPVNHTHPDFLEMVGPGACWLDAEGDGDLDLYLVSGQHVTHPERNAALDPHSRLYLQAEGHFTEAGPDRGAELRGQSYGCAAADADNDGDPDLYVTGWGGGVLLRNAGGAFEDATAAAGVGDAACGAWPCWAIGASWLDYDRDGCADLLVAHFGIYDVDDPPEHVGPEHVPPQANRLYHNRCDGTFEDRTAAAGLVEARHTWSTVAADLDDDGWVDLYASNDGEPNDIYWNRGDGTFAHEDNDPRHGMGTAVADYDHDGRLDVVSTNYLLEHNAILRRDGAGWQDIGADEPFIDAWENSGWAAGWPDLQNDGHPDLMVLNGMTEDSAEPVPGPEPVLVYENLGTGPGAAAFRTVRDDLGPALAASYAARGGAWGDYDDDGDVDLLLAEGGQRPTHLLRADGGGGSFLSLQLVGAAPGVTRDALGAKVLVRAAGLPEQRLDRIAGSGFLSTSDARLHAGLGLAAAAEVEVHWPDGSVEVHPGLRANAFHRLTQGAPPVVLRELPLVQVEAPGAWPRGEPLTLRAAATPGAGASLASLRWAFGDGAMASGAEVRHTFLADGPFTVTVTATDTAGRAKVEARRVVAIDALTAEVRMAKPGFLPVEAAEGVVRVTYRDGSPVPGAAVHLRWTHRSGFAEVDAAAAALPPGIRESLGYREELRNGTTDAAGTFAFSVQSLRLAPPSPVLPAPPGLGNHPGIDTVAVSGGTRWNAFAPASATYRVGPGLEVS